MSCKLESAIWSRDTGQRIPCFDRCQLVIARMSNIKEVPKYTVNQGCMSGRHLGQLRRRRRRRRRRRAYAPTSNTASHDNHEKINPWVSFSFPYEYGKQKEIHEVHFLMVIMDSGTARGRVRTTVTTMSRNMATILQIIG